MWIRDDISNACTYEIFANGITGTVAAINSFYVSLGSPSLPGWVASGGDPCGGSIPWQGVTCDDSSSISSMYGHLLKTEWSCMFDLTKS